MSKWLKADNANKPIGVDRQANVIRGYVVAQAGPFKSEGRGEFDHKSLKLIWRQMRANETGGRTGTKSRFSHPTLSADGLGTFLGRARNPQMATARDARTGEEVEAVRADLHLDPAAFNSPTHGDLGNYVMGLAESDPEALSSSLVLQVSEEWRLDSKGRKVVGDDGKELPPLWRPTAIHASDIVDTGDAVDGFLSASLSIDGLNDSLVRQAWPIAKQAFEGLSKSEIRRRLSGYMERIVEMLGEDDEPQDEPADAELQARLRKVWLLENSVDAA